MATFTFKPVPVWGSPGSFARVGVAARRTFPATTPAGASVTVMQGGVTKVGYVESDDKGLIPQFTTTDVPTVLLDLGFGTVTLYAIEAVTAGAASAATATAAATDAQTARDGAVAARDTAIATVASKAPLPAAQKNPLTGWFHADGFGAVGNDAALDTAPLQAAIDAADAAGGGRVYLKAGTYRTDALLLPSKVSLIGDGSGGQVGNSTKLRYVGSAGGTLLSPKVRTGDTINWTITGIDLNGNALAAIGLEMYRVSYSRVQDVSVYGLQAGGVGVLLDANVSGQCYFNVIDNVKVDGAPTGVRFQRGANANRWVGGKIGNGGTGMEFLTLSSGNIVIATDLEENTVRHVYLDAGANVFVGLHMEISPIGYSITTNGAGTRRIGTTFAASVATYVSDASTIAGALDETTSDTYQLKVGGTNVLSRTLSGSTTLSLDPVPFSGTASVVLSIFRNITTTGTKQFNLYRGNGSTDTGFAVDLTTRVITLGNTATTGAGGGQGVVAISNAAVVPASNPAGGGVLYVEGGALKFKGSGGTVTVIAPA